MRPNILNCVEFYIELVGSKLTFYFGLQDRRELPVEINGMDFCEGAVVVEE